VSTSGDGTLSVVDIRSKKAEPYAQSEDQEDELLSIAAIRGYDLHISSFSHALTLCLCSGKKFVVGTQIGILSVFNKSSGWGDCVDRVPGHPSSIDTLCNLPDRYPSAHSTLLTGSSDGLVRAVQLFPTKLLGVVADHGEFPVERIVVDRKGEGEWVGSVGHEEGIKLTHLRGVFEDEEEEKEEDADGDRDDNSKDTGEDNEDSSDEGSNTAIREKLKNASPPNQLRHQDADKQIDGDEHEDDSDGQDSNEGEEVEIETTKKRKRKEKDPLAASRKKKGRNEIDGNRAFFADL
jgi:WD repeat-containing protein 55